MAQVMELQRRLEKMQEEANRDRCEKEALRQKNVQLERRVEQLLAGKEAISAEATYHMTNGN